MKVKEMFSYTYTERMCVMKRTLGYFGCATLALLAVSCGSKKSSSAPPAAASTAPGVTASTGNTVVIGGKLAAAASLTDSFGLASTQRQLLYFSLLGGNIMGAPQAITADAAGSFSVKVSKVNDTLVAAQAAIAQTPVDKVPLEKAFPSYASQIAVMSDDVIKSQLSSFLTQMASQGGPQYILVSYVPSGDALAEAKSFQFVGMPTSGNNVMVFPGDALMGNLSLGTVTGGAGDDATSELKADATVLSLTDKQIKEIASVGQTLKMVKNYWVNKQADGSVSLEAQPFFMWNGKISDLVAVAGGSDPAAGGSDPAAAVYSGYGMYVQDSLDTAIQFSKMCPAATGSGQSMVFGTPTQILNLFPPAQIAWQVRNWNGTLSSATYFDASTPLNNGSTSLQSQNGKNVCNGGASGFYARDDGDGNYMFNWGTGGSLQGKVPAGFWDLQIDSTSRGKFDLSAAYPVDADGNSKIPVPRVSYTKDGNNVSNVTFTLAVYDPAAKAFVDMNDLALFKKMASQISVSVNILNGSGADEVRGVYQRTASSDAPLTVDLNADGSTFSTTLPAQYQKPFATSYSGSGTISSIMISYVIGGSNYAFGFGIN